MNILFDSGSEQDPLFHVSPRQRRIALILSLALILFTVVIIFFAHIHLPKLVLFFPALGAWGVLGDILTAFILFNQFRASRIRPLLVLGCTYLFTGLVSLFYLLALTGVLPDSGPFAPNAQTSIWFWCFWQLSFPCGILVFSHSIRKQSDRVPLQHLPRYLFVGTSIVLLGAAGLFLFGTFGDSLLPKLIENGDYGRLLTSGVGPVLWLLSLAAFLSVLLPYRKRGVLRIWIIVAMLAFLLGLTLSLVAGERYTIGWYGARVDSLIASVIVLLALIAEVNKLFVRLTRQHEELEESKQALEEANKRLKELSLVDGLTRIANRRQFDEVLAQELDAPQREKEFLSLLLIDVDYFKAYNDHYGHLGGDMVLRSVASRLETEALAHFGFTARYGGEEFAVILPGHSERETEQIAELLIESVRSLSIPHQYSSVSNQITISVGGFTMRPGEHFNANELISKADAALYQAKAEGRARFVLTGTGVELSRGPVN
ncbi:sensor domain-containing diguanylate cyclase [Saccharibacillus kuerlensis]|uniref:GGDEF domain-containing protein n=1 Tax=Saccharibacillus kuerlensis TaxID=459527 RepID=A0ABQ2L4B3_9BACL|nr:diguanylate cyclase [Saccharibacillus kuerlensis]GGO00115.1 GGDEF domain-containing protein [Saccharibacillus kuerlensis]